MISQFPPLTPVQWAAVITCLGPISVPPQNGLLEPGRTRATCHGREYGVTSDPPTMREGLTPQPIMITSKLKDFNEKASSLDYLTL